MHTPCCSSVPRGSGLSTTGGFVFSIGPGSKPQPKTRRPEKVRTLPDAGLPGTGLTRAGQRLSQDLGGSMDPGPGCIMTSQRPRMGDLVGWSWDLGCTVGDGCFKDAAPSLKEQGWGDRVEKVEKASRGTQSRRNEARAGGWPGRTKAACGPGDVCPLPYPPNENERAARPPATGSVHCNRGRAGAGACLLAAPRRPPSCFPDSLQPSGARGPRGAARPRSQPGRRRGRFQSAGRRRGRAWGARREATANLAGAGRKFLLAGPCGAPTGTQSRV